MKKKLRNLKNNFFKKQLPLICHKSRTLSSLYYLAFHSGFSREHSAVLAGKVKHIKEAEELKANYFLLVRNTHRLEKGLLMRPRKPVFGLDYIGETIDSFEGIWTTSKDDKFTPQLKWFHDVLDEYFKSSAQDAKLEPYKNRFYKAIANNSSELSLEPAKPAIPYYRLEADKANISYDEFFKLTRHRRSVRWFLDKPVPRDLIDKAILAANQSPSACNRQPFEFRVFDDPALVKEVSKLPMGTSGYGHSIPVFIVIVGNLDAYFDERDRHIIYIDASLASMALMLALETMGLSSCSINWPDIEAREIKMEKFLRLEKHQRPIMCLGLGYPDPEGMVAFSEKRSLNQIRKYN